MSDSEVFGLLANTKEPVAAAIANSPSILVRLGDDMAMSEASPDPRAVFVVHGRNEVARAQMFAFLRAIGLDPIEWSEAVRMTGKGAPYVGEVLDAAFDRAQAVVVLFTPDEIAYLRGEYASREDDAELMPTAQSRPNVLFEAGIATGRNSDRTILVQLGEIRPFSDVAGKHAIRLDDSVEKRKELAQRLETAGCPVKLSGQDWMKTGTFTVPEPPGGGLPLGKRLPSAARKRVRIDLRFSNRHLEIINSGTEDIFNVDVEIPEDKTQFRLADRGELPLDRIPSGKSARITAFYPRTKPPSWPAHTPHASGRPPVTLATLAG